MSPCSAATGMPPHVLRAWAVYWIVYIWARGAEPRVETKEMRVWWADAVVTRAGLHFWVSRSALWKENTFNTDSLTAMQTASVQFPAPEKEQSFSYKLAATRVGLFQTFNRFFHTLAPKFRCFFFWTSSNFYGSPPTLAAVRYQEPEQAPRRTPRQHGNTIIQTLKIVTKMTSVIDSGPCRSEFWITTTEWVTWNFNCSMIVVCWGLPKPCNSGKKHHP